MTALASSLCVWGEEAVWALDDHSNTLLLYQAASYQLCATYRWVARRHKQHDTGERTEVMILCYHDDSSSCLEEEVILRQPLSNHVLKGPSLSGSSVTGVGTDVN